MEKCQIANALIEPVWMSELPCYRLSRFTSGLLVGGVRPRRVTIFGYES